MEVRMFVIAVSAKEGPPNVVNVQGILPGMLLLSGLPGKFPPMSLVLRVDFPVGVARDTVPVEISVVDADRRQFGGIPSINIDVVPRSISDDPSGPKSIGVIVDLQTMPPIDAQSGGWFYLHAEVGGMNVGYLPFRIAG
jgi:hypothetical protein